MDATATSMPTNSLRRSTLLTMIFAVILSYPFAILFFGPKAAIEIGNVMVLALSAGIVVAYGPIVRDALRHHYIDGPHILTIGIFLGWAATFFARGGSIIWRLMGQPPDWLNSSLWGFHIALSCASALAHLVAPGAVAGRVPTRQWLRIGALVAIGVLFVSGLFALVKLEVFTMVKAGALDYWG